MSHSKDVLIENLNNPDMDIRLSSLKSLMQMVTSGEITVVAKGVDVNNHIHTWYSFSPYSPTKAVWMAVCAGLTTAGIMDHDSVAGLVEFRLAGEIAGIGTTGGVECRVHVKGSDFSDRRINNPDQNGVIYMAIHAIPLTQVGQIDAFLAPLRHRRNERNRKMTMRLDDIFKQYGIRLDFDKDVLPISQFDAGGSVTERHILYALSKNIIEKVSLGQPLIDFVKNTLGLSLPKRVEDWLADGDSFNSPYDLLGVLKAELVGKFYIDADEECPHISEVIALANRASAISAYAYLGDVGDSLTGDKKPQLFEDSYLPQLFEYLKSLNLNAITYMPSRNTPAQMERLKSLCTQKELFEISGEDINTPRQAFVCVAARSAEFANLIDSAWALIGHELVCEQDEKEGMFSVESIQTTPSLQQRILGLSAIGRELSSKGEIL